jgi:hypothetical protein
LYLYISYVLVVSILLSFYMLNYKLNHFFYNLIIFKNISNNILLAIYTILTGSKETLIKNFVFLPKYYSRNENIWVDGFLFDFLQKKSADLWIRKFVIYTGFLFSERLVFDSVVRIYLDNVLWPLHYFGSLEANNVLEMLLINIFFYFLLFAIIILLYICLF